MTFWQEFQGPNAGYILELYERYLEDPSSVDELTRQAFDRWGAPELVIPNGAISVPAGSVDVGKAVAVAKLAQAIRAYGHLAAQLDPLGSKPPGDPHLELSFYKLDEDDLRSLPAELVGLVGQRLDGSEPKNALEAITSLRKVYSGRIAFDYSHITKPEERQWFQQVVETDRYHPPHDPINPRRLLERLTQVEAFERFLHRTFPGKTRFSIEGLDLMVPILDELIGAAAEGGVCMFFLGMAHRGRLNVLRHIQNKDFSQILAEFKEPNMNFTVWDELGWTGDVKYHKGALRALESDEVIELVVVMPPNPSHLEHINPVLEGMARAADTDLSRPGAPRFFPKASVPILIHGDAAFPGQGVVAETLNLSRIPGYQTAGTIHLIANNQLGYTATIKETRSTLQASDLGKGFKIPVIYVNADAPEASIEAARIAFAYRERFQKDVIIDLIGYRRYGHNEGDEPTFTQPLLYETIQNHPTVRQIWASELDQRGEIEGGEADQMLQAELDQLQQVYDAFKPEESLKDDLPEPAPPGAARQMQTSVPFERLRELNSALLGIPEGFHLNRKLARGRERRLKLFDQPVQEISIDWATAEELAFATILQDGTPIRLTGEDVIRGTFSHRHAVFYDIENGQGHTPLQSFPQAKAGFEIYNSPVTETAVIGFEYGYNVAVPGRLVIWEAQYGDFINIAQVMLDEFLISARSKWGQTPSLVLLLPHGNEGQGPDHSSARLERFLQMVAENNLRVAYPTTAAQYFHLLRRQAMLLLVDPLPLIVMTPKGLLRHPLTASRPAEFSEMNWRPVLEDGPPDSDGKAGRKSIRRLVFCTGRVYVDIASYEARQEVEGLAIARLEQLAPFPVSGVRDILGHYPNLEEVIWIQEEPRNMGAWDYVRPRLEALIENRWPLHYLGRSPSSSPAEGSASWYAVNQKALIDELYRPSETFTGQGVLVERG